jgi:hypothetical protein
VLPAGAPRDRGGPDGGVEEQLIQHLSALSSESCCLAEACIGGLAERDYNRERRCVAA